MNPISRGDLYFLHIPQEYRAEHEECFTHMHVVVSPNEINRIGQIAILVPLTSPENKEGQIKNTGQYQKFRIPIKAAQKHWDVDSPHKQEGDSLAKTEQVFCCCQTRLRELKRCGTLDPIALFSIEAGLQYVLGMPPLGAMQRSIAQRGQPLRPPVNVR